MKSVWLVQVQFAGERCETIGVSRSRKTAKKIIKKYPDTLKQEEGTGLRVRGVLYQDYDLARRADCKDDWDLNVRVTPDAALVMIAGLSRRKVPVLK